MESHEVMRKMVNSVGVKHVASEMGLSGSLIYKWCQPKDSPDAAGADNPLDRLARICELTGDTGPVEWLCRKVDGFFVKNPPMGESHYPFPLKATQEILSEFSGLLDVVSRSLEDDQIIDGKEAGRIRTVWETLKSVTETFVCACEDGAYSGTENGNAGKQSADQGH